MVAILIFPQDLHQLQQQQQFLRRFSAKPHFSMIAEMMS